MGSMGTPLSGPGGPWFGIFIIFAAAQQPSPGGAARKPATFDRDMVRLYYMEFPGKINTGRRVISSRPFFVPIFTFFRESFIMKVSHSRVIF